MLPLELPGPVPKLLAQGRQDVGLRRRRAHMEHPFLWAAWGLSQLVTTPRGQVGRLMWGGQGAGFLTSSKVESYS